DGQSWYMTYDARAMSAKIQYAVTDGATKQTLADFGTRSVAGSPRQRNTSFPNKPQRAWTYDVLGRVLTDQVNVAGDVRLDRGFSYFQDGNVHTVMCGNYGPG